MKPRWIMPAGWVFLVLTGLVGCSPAAALAPVDDGSDLSTPLPATTPIRVAQPANPLLQPPFGAELTTSINMARQDLARKLGESPDGITVISVIGGEFSINAFYCRSIKGRIAKDDPPADISGFSILLSASGRRYEYHASGQTVFFCRPLP